MATKIISNDELYEKYPHAHEFALQAFQDEGIIDDVNYPAVEAWEVVDEEPVTQIVKPIFADWHENGLQQA